MADQFTQKANGTGTTTVALTLNGVVAGSTLVAFLFNGQGGSTLSVADGQGSYTAKSAVAGPDGNNVAGRAFVLDNANSGSHTITGTTNSGNAAFMSVAEIGGSGAGATTGGSSAAQNSPGTGADAISSGSMAVTGNCTLLAISTDSAVVNVVDEPTVGTGFTSRDSGANTTIGSWTLESKAVSANAAGTFTAILGLSQYITLGVAITNSSGATFSPGWATGATKTTVGVF